MEFHKIKKTKINPKILTKKKITQKVYIYSSRSQTNISAINKFPNQSENFTERTKNTNELTPVQSKNISLMENAKNKIKEKRETKGIIKNIPPSSLVINLHPKYQKKQPIKKNMSQIKNPNPMKQIEYQYQIQSLNSSQKSNPISIKNNSKNNSKEKNSNSSFIIPSLYNHMNLSSNNTNNNVNVNKKELEIEINSDFEEQTPKIRYHRTKNIVLF